MEHPTLLHRWFEEVWNQGRETAIDELLSEHGMIHALDEAGNDTIGPAGFKPFFEKMRNAFPDMRVTIHDAIQQGDRVAARWTVRMTHRGDGLGVTATGKPVTITGMSFVRTADGKIVEGWNNWDVLSMMQQVGALPALRQA